jgi:hypothetical protein
MIKPLIILFNTVSVFLFSFFFGDSPVTISGNFPKSVKPNTEFTTEIVIKKAAIGGFAKLQIEVPQGFTVKEMDSRNGNFSFTNNIAKIIWTAIPTEPDFTVKFIFIADASVTGLKTITSKFSYVSNNEKAMVEMTPAEIMVGENEMATNNPTDSSKSEPIVSSETKTETPVVTQNTESVSQKTSQDNSTEQNSDIICNRLISKGASQNEINISVKIKKGNIKGFAKYQEVLPAGCTAKSVTTSGSSFSVSDGKAKFVWVSLPEDEELVISYVLETSNLTPLDAKLEKGEFSYLENDQSKKTKLPVELISGNSDISSVKTNTESVNNAINQPTVNATNTESVVSNNAVDTPITKNENNNVIAKKEGNVLFLVQIGAFRAAIATETLAKKFNLSENIKSEMAEGYNKFMVGNFNEYKLARNHRETIKQKGCASAFVAAYNGPKRITVQEALMITNQRWFK